VNTPPLCEPSSVWEEDKRTAVFTGTPPGGLTLLAESPVPPVDHQLGANLGAVLGIRVGATPGEIG
jgi:hypothetical protein